MKPETPESIEQLRRSLKATEDAIARCVDDRLRKPLQARRDEVAVALEIAERGGELPALEERLQEIEQRMNEIDPKDTETVHGLIDEHEKVEAEIRAARRREREVR